MMFRNVVKDSLVFVVKNLIKLLLVLAMSLSLIMICIVIPLWVLNSKVLFYISLCFLVPLVVCSLSTYVASLLRENDSIYNSFLLFENRYIRNIVVMMYIILGIFIGPFIILNRDIMNENIQIPVIIVSCIISIIFIVKYRYIHLVLAENPNMSVIRIFKKNKEIMKNNNIKRIITSIAVSSLPVLITAFLYNRLYDKINPTIILSIGSIVTYIIKEVVDLSIYRRICGHVYLQFNKLKELNSAKVNSNNMEIKSIKKVDTIKIHEEKNEYDEYLNKQIVNNKYNKNIKFVEKYVKQ